MTSGIWKRIRGTRRWRLRRRVQHLTVVLLRPRGRPIARGRERIPRPRPEARVGVSTGPFVILSPQEEGSPRGPDPALPNTLGSTACPRVLSRDLRTSECPQTGPEGPKGPPRRAKRAQKRPKIIPMRPRSRLDCPRASNAPQEASKSTPKKQNTLIPF